MPHSETTRQPAATRPLLGALTGFVAVWGLVLAASWSSLTAYGFKRDVLNDAPSAYWPADSQIARRADRSLLLVFLHPMCPCSHATISELESILPTQNHGADRNPDVAIVACTPRSMTETWTRTSLVQRAAQLPRAKVYADVGGVEAARFAATTSGEVVLVDASGKRLYAGGVTKSRGHVGGNAGAEAVARLLRGEPEAGAVLPALGCRLVRDAGHDSSNRGESAGSCEGIKS
ncbi:MAG: RedB protein [Pirellulales bacterium]|nr:RedB protein [Pirellulales bacterium]